MSPVTSPVRGPLNAADVTEVNPARLAAVPPSEIAVEPNVMPLFDSLALPIEPANIVLVTVPVSVV